MPARRAARIPVAALITLVACASVSAAECKPDSASTNRTLFTGIRAFHLDEAGTSITVNDKPTAMVGVDIVVAICRWPAYSLSFGGETLGEIVQTSYIAPGSTDFHPPLTLNTIALTLTRRWRDSSIFHPMASLRVGSIDAEYTYYHRVNGITETHIDSSSKTTLVAPSVGVEVSVFKYMTMYGGVGHRFMGRLNTFELTNRGLSGTYALFGMGFGKFR